MLRNYTAACLLATALTVVPAFAQTPHPSSATQDFVTNAAIGGMFEIQSSQLALDKSQDRDVKKAAQKIIEDHRRADDKLKLLAKGEQIPTSLDAKHQQMLTKLQGENGSAFVDGWKQAQVDAHHEAIDLFQNYARSGDDQQLKQFASQTIPTLQQHLQMVQSITVAANTNGNTPNAQNGAGDHVYLTDETPGTWRASKVIGLNVYNEQDQKVGDINEVLFDRDGKVEGVVIGVGGFLGIGERNVAVRYDELKWSMTPVRGGVSVAGNGMTPASNGNPSATGTNAPGLASPTVTTPPSAPTAGPITPTTQRMASNNTGASTTAYPDHAILPNASKQLLQNAPQFNYGQPPR